MGLFSSLFLSLVALLLLALGSFIGALAGFHFFLGVLLPYFAVFLFLTGFLYRVYSWVRSPVPFNITTTAGQQSSLNWIAADRFENPSSKSGVWGRMFLEVFFFRSLFRNTKAVPKKERGFGFVAEKSLWAGALVFHWAFLLIFLRHFRYFFPDIPLFVSMVERFDGLFQIGLPVFYLTDALFLMSLGFLFLRRILLPRVRYFSYAADYFPLLLLIAIAASGIAMRYFVHIDIVRVKTSMVSLFTLEPFADPDLSPLFFTHLSLVSFLFIYFPFSKLMHMGGIWFSPTRNMRADTRRLRHENPWNYPVKVHSYEEYEDEFRELMVKAGLPVERQGSPDANDSSQDPELASAENHSKKSKGETLS